MIYDKGPLAVYTLAGGGSPLTGRLEALSQHLYQELEVYHARYWESVQAGSRIDTMLRVPFGDEIEASHYCIPADGHVYRILQAQHGRDEDGLPCCTLSLQREEKNYDVVGRS